MVAAIVFIVILVALVLYRRHISREYFNVSEEPEIRTCYYCTKYPPDIGYVPFVGMIESADYGERRYIPEIDRMAWGRVVYNRELNYSEIRAYGLVSEPRD